MGSVRERATAVPRRGIRARRFAESQFAVAAAGVQYEERMRSRFFETATAVLVSAATR